VRPNDGQWAAERKPAEKQLPTHGWRRTLWQLTRINVGPSPDDVYDLACYDRIRHAAPDTYQIAVIGLKGGVGRTTVTAALGSTFSAVRGDRILALDVDPNGGNLADRTARQSPATVDHLLVDPHLLRYNDVRSYTQMNEAGLEVLAAPEYTGGRHEFNADDWRAATRIVAPYYNIVLADTGRGLHNPAARAALSSVSSLVIVCSATTDGARQAAVTMNWLGRNGFQHLVPRSCVVINNLVPAKPQIDVADLTHQYEQLVGRGRVVALPWDTHIAAGGEIALNSTSRNYRRRIVALAAALSEDFASLGAAVSAGAARHAAPRRPEQPRVADAAGAAGQQRRAPYHH